MGFGMGWRERETHSMPKPIYTKWYSFSLGHRVSARWLEGSKARPSPRAGVDPQASRPSVPKALGPGGSARFSVGLDCVRWGVWGCPRPDQDMSWSHPEATSLFSLPVVAVRAAASARDRGRQWVAAVAGVAAVARAAAVATPTLLPPTPPPLTSNPLAAMEKR